jgi:hypothetical protein
VTVELLALVDVFDGKVRCLQLKNATMREAHISTVTHSFALDDDLALLDGELPLPP